MPRLRSWLLPLISLVPALWLLWRDQYNILTAMLAALPLVILALIDVPAAIYSTFVFLFLLGDIRRIAGYFLGFPSKDPLLLVGPLITFLFSAPLWFRLRLKDNISKAVFAVTVLMVLEIFNPRQGSLTVGLTGAFYELVPILWYWIGREYGTDDTVRVMLYRVVLPLSVLAALLGFAQTYIGFLPWEQVWIKAVSSTYHSLSVGGFTRAFGFSVNSIEYTDLLLVGCVIVLGGVFSRKRALILLLPLLAVMLFLESARTPIFRVLVSAAFSWAFSAKGGQRWRGRLLLAICVGFGGLLAAASHASGDQNANQPRAKTAAQAASQHQISGLAHPLDSKRSTAAAHGRYFWGGVVQGFKYPIGSGLGVLRSGAAPGGSSEGEDTAGLNATEYDISDNFITLGFVGGLIYIYIIGLVLKRSVDFARVAPTDIGLPMVGLLVSMLGSWIALGQYAIAPLMWFLIGSITRSRTAHMQRVPAYADFLHDDWHRSQTIEQPA